MNIGIITNHSESIFQKLVIEGIHAAAPPICNMLVVSHHQLGTPQYIPLNMSQLDGIIVIANAASDEILEHANAIGIPVSLVSHTVRQPFPSVFFNNAQGIRELVYHLAVQCQRKYPLFIRGIPDQIDGAERESAYRTELLRHLLNIDEARFINGEFDPNIAANALEQIIKDGIQFDAIISTDYIMAVAALEVLQAHHIRVPDDISVVAFGDAKKAQRANLTTVSANVEELGRCAMLQLLAQIDGHIIRGRTLLSVQLVVRHSTGG